MIDVRTKIKRTNSNFPYKSTKNWSHETNPLSGKY